MKKVSGFVAVALLSFSAMAFGQSTPTHGEGTTTAQDIKQFSLQTKPISGKNAPASYVPGAGYLTSTWVDLGASDFPEYTLTIWGLNLSTYSPAAISCQPRQNWNYDYGFPDAFACQVVTTAADHIVVRVRRLDQYSGWGQDLRLDLIIFDWVNN
jgi:hypothetical protein